MKLPKEPYFTASTITEQAENMLTSLKGLTYRHATPFTPSRSALLVLDMQAYFTDEASHAYIPSATAILPGVNALIQAFTSANLPVYLTRHLNTPQDAGLMAVWWRDLLSADSPLSKLDPRLEIGSGITFHKTRYDAFWDSPLELFLHSGQIQQVVICGVMTHLCCETTARSAFMRSYEVFFTVDGTATYSEAFHRASLLNLAHGFATPVLVKDILTILEEDPDG